MLARAAPTSPRLGWEHQARALEAVVNDRTAVLNQRSAALEASLARVEASEADVARLETRQTTLAREKAAVEDDRGFVELIARQASCSRKLTDFLGAVADGDYFYAEAMTDDLARTCAEATASFARLQEELG